MLPLNNLMNYSAELAQTSSFFSKNIEPRFLMAASFPIELLAILENTIKLPFQAAALTVKIPAKLLNIVINSTSFKAFEAELPTFRNLFETALKIIGYVIGSLFTATLGIFSPYKNFQFHCSLKLIKNEKNEKVLRLIEENRKKEITLCEKVLQTRLYNIVDALRKKNQTGASPIRLPMDDQISLQEKLEIENEFITETVGPNMEETIQETISQ